MLHQGPHIRSLDSSELGGGGLGEVLAVLVDRVLMVQWQAISGAHFGAQREALGAVPSPNLLNGVQGPPQSGPREGPSSSKWTVTSRLEMPGKGRACGQGGRGGQPCIPQPQISACHADLRRLLDRAVPA